MSINALYHALRALDPQTFEDLLVHLLKRRYPGIDIKHVNGLGGDQGLDVISGNLDDAPTIWQCKAFSSGIKGPQRKQIKESLKRALAHCVPRRWVLCVSTDLDAAAHRWFQRLTQSNASTLEIALLQASDLVHQLLYEDTIRERFFPQILLNVSMLREGLARTDAFSTDELVALNAQNVQVYLTRLQAYDSRFTYSITFQRDQPSARTHAPGALLTIARNDAVIHVFARDKQSLLAHPPKVHFSIKGTGLEKFLDHQRTGRPQHFTAEELVGVSSDFDFLLPPARPGMLLTLGKTHTSAPLAFRVTFGTGTDAVVYEYVTFQRTRCGTEEAVFESTSKLPFQINLLLCANGIGKVGFTYQSSGQGIAEVFRMTRAILAVIKSQHFDVYDLREGKTFLRTKFEGQEPRWLTQFHSMLEDATVVAAGYNTVFTMPDVITAEDHPTLDLLRGLLTGVRVEGEPLVLTLAKLADSDEVAVRGLLDDGCSLRLIRQEFPERLVVFGKHLRTGPVQYDVTRGRLRDPQVLRSFLDSAPIGKTIDVAIDSLDAILVQRLTPTEVRPPQLP